MNKDTRTTSAFHTGEQILQARVGKHKVMEKIGHRAIRQSMPEQHRQFYEALPFIVVGGVDANGWPWATLLTGKPGFITSPDAQTLNIKTQAPASDPLAPVLDEANSPLGLLGIELMTRRRNRMNGHITVSDYDGFSVKVDQSFGNCPQYIQNWDINFVRSPDSTTQNQQSSFTTLNDETKQWIEKSNLFFVSSYSLTEDLSNIAGVDVSHRGGKAGFVKVEGNTLTIPDYAGNFFFNTLGNFLVNPKAGLVFIDFETGSLLMLSGTVELLWDKTAEFEAFEGAERAWRFTLNHGITQYDALPFRGTLKGYSPQSLNTGSWDQVPKTYSNQTEA